MEKTMNFLSFWAINDDLNIERLKECPHHYLEGDYRLTSPMHYQGNKHFGDEDDAPDHTHVPCYHFVKFGIGG